MEMMGLLQSLVAITAQCCQLASNDDHSLSSQREVMARELAYLIKGKLQKKLDPWRFFFMNKKKI